MACEENAKHTIYTFWRVYKCKKFLSKRYLSRHLSRFHCVLSHWLRPRQCAILSRTRFKAARTSYTCINQQRIIINAICNQFEKNLIILRVCAHVRREFNVVYLCACVCFFPNNDSNPPGEPIVLNRSHERNKIDTLDRDTKRRV